MPPQRPPAVTWLYRALAATLVRLCDPDRVLGRRLERDRERRLLPGALRGHVRPAHRGPLDSPPPGRGAGRRGAAWACCSPPWRSGSTRHATCCSAGGTCSSQTSFTSTSGSTRSSTTPTSSAATWRSAWLLWAPIWLGPVDARAAVVAAAVAGVLLGALALSYSITSFAALVAGLLVVVALRWSLRWALAGGAGDPDLRGDLPARQRHR